MKQIKRFLEEVQSMEAFIVNRGDQKIVAEGYDNYKFDCIVFNSDSIDVKFVENTRYEWPDYYMACLSIKELEMSELEWFNHIEGIIKITNQKKKEKEDKEKALEKETKLSNYLNLKKELGL